MGKKSNEVRLWRSDSLRAGCPSERLCTHAEKSNDVGLWRSDCFSRGPLDKTLDSCREVCMAGSLWFIYSNFYYFVPELELLIYFPSSGTRNRRRTDVNITKGQNLTETNMIRLRFGARDWIGKKRPLEKNSVETICKKWPHTTQLKVVDLEKKMWMHEVDTTGIDVKNPTPHRDCVFADRFDKYFSNSRFSGSDPSQTLLQPMTW